MAINIPGLKFLNAADSKSRVLIVLAVVVVVSLAIFFGSQFLDGSSSAIGPSSVAAPPSSLQSIPGGQVSAEYSQALIQANTQAAQQAQMTGGSAVPTLINTGNTFQNQNCTPACPTDESANVADGINTLVSQGKMAQDTASRLLNLAKQKVSVDEYAETLNDLVKQGKLTPEQARMLLDQYRKQHKNDLLAESSKSMDALIKSGALPLEAANQLLMLQKAGATPEQYADELNRLVKEGVISRDTANRLLSQYAKQKQDEDTKRSNFALQQLAKRGALSPADSKRLMDLQASNVSASEYQDALQDLVRRGKLSPEEAQRLLSIYKSSHPMSQTEQMITKLIANTQAQCDKDLVAAKLKNDTALPASCQKVNSLKNLLVKLRNKNLSPAALKLGAKHVIAIDNDPQAIEASLQNAALNDLVEHQFVAGLPNQNISQADILIANILANPLKSLAEVFSQTIKSGGKIAVSGILHEQIEEIEKNFSTWFDLNCVKYQDDWCLLAGVRK